MSPTLSRSKLALLFSIAILLIFSLLHGLFLQGSILALVIIVFSQVYLPGWLLLRLLRLNNQHHPVLQLVWILAAGLGFTIVVGSGARLLQVPITLYLILLHLAMALMVWLSPAPSEIPDKPRWRLNRNNAAGYALLVLCCALGFFFGLDRSRLRYDGWEDQTVFSSQLEWLAYNPGDPGLLTRELGASFTDPRFSSDGWTYNHAAWVWSSGVPSASLIWYDLTPLFAWLTPLIAFALAYILSGRETAALLTAVAFTLASLITIDSLIYYPNIAYGQNGFIQINTLRMFSTAIPLPMAQMAGAAYLLQKRKGYLIIFALLTVSLALLHPRQITILAMTIIPFAGLFWLTKPHKERLQTGILILLVVGAALILPYIQRGLVQQQIEAINLTLDPISTWKAETTATNVPVTMPSYLVMLNNVPVLGKTLTVNPSSVFYSPLIVIAAIIGLLVPLARREPITWFIFGATITTLILLFLPGVAELFIKIVSYRVVRGFVLALPLGLAFGIALEIVTKWLSKSTMIQNWALPTLLCVGLLLVAFEPIPLPFSPRDQNRAMNEIQELRDIQPAETALIETFNSNPALHFSKSTVLLVPNRISGYIVESVSATLITGGRSSENPDGAASTDRFFGLTNPPVLFLDSQDIQFIHDTHTEYIVIEATASRVPQLLMQPDRFTMIDDVDGYLIFHVLNADPRPEDKQFLTLNQFYESKGQYCWMPLWVKPGCTGNRIWNEHVAQWDVKTSAGQLGAAFSLFMAGNFEDALPLWQGLHEAYPSNAFILQALSYSFAQTQRSPEAVALLQKALASSDATAQITAAALLFSEPFFFQLDQAELDSVLQITRTQAVGWNMLVIRGQTDVVRQQTALLVSAGRLDEADQWLGLIPAPEVSPDDLTLRASIRLSRQQAEAALALLSPYRDEDVIAAAKLLHPAYWTSNTVKGLYALLQGDLASRNGDFQSALVWYTEATINGMEITGRVFAAQTQALMGDLDAANATLDELAAANTKDAVLWAIAARLEINQSHDVGLLNTLNEELKARSFPPVGFDTLPKLHSLLDTPNNLETTLLETKILSDNSTDVQALFGQGAGSAFRPTVWEAHLLNPTDASSYGSVTMPALYVPGALVEWNLSFPPVKTQPFTPATLVVQTSYSNYILYPATYASLTLNPVAADESKIAQPRDYTLDGNIQLRGYTLEAATADTFSLTLYWQAKQRLIEDYQVFIHVLNDSGEEVGGRDNTPLNGRYPTSQWIANTLFADSYQLNFNPPLTDGNYHIIVGMYRLSDMTRLEVAPTDSNVRDQSIELGQFSIREGSS